MVEFMASDNHTGSERLSVRPCQRLPTNAVMCISENALDYEPRKVDAYCLQELALAVRSP
jgi:hypothetical protein